MKVKIDSRGRITIPEAIRETLGFNDVAHLEIKNNKIIITKNIDLIENLNTMIEDINYCEHKLLLEEIKNKVNKLHIYNKNKNKNIISKKRRCKNGN